MAVRGAPGRSLSAVHPRWRTAQRCADTTPAAQVQRVKEGDILALSKGLNTSKAALEAARAELSTTQAALRVRAVGVGRCPAHWLLHSATCARGARGPLSTPPGMRARRGAPQASEAALAKANHELAVTRDELTRAASVAARAAAADARLVKSEGTVPAGACFWVCACARHVWWWAACVPM
jgi:multidrug efflux pump subunit AcrA (membrane-fusion protein)